MAGWLTMQRSDTKYSDMRLAVLRSRSSERKGYSPRENIARPVARLLNLTDGAVCAYHTERIMIEMEVAEW